MAGMLTAGLLLVLCAARPVQAQSYPVEGTVRVAEDQTTLPGVTVVLKGTTRGTQSDVTGHYSLTASSPSDTLVFSFLGFVTQEVPIAGRVKIDVELAVDQLSGDEVVVVGYGTQRITNVTGSVSTVDGDEIADRPITQASQVLQGLASGVYVNTSSGQPGADASQIRIRGAGTLGNSSPLVLIDGVESDISKLNPRDILSVTVLKDAASAAIYGSRAANGVILYQTRSGSATGGLRVEYDGYAGVQSATILPDQVSNSVEWMQMLNTALVAEGRGPQFTAEQISEYEANSGTNSLVYPNTDWVDVMFNAVPITENNLRISGGSSALRYALSGGYLTQDGVLRGTSGNRATFRLNLDSDVSSRFSIGVRANGSRLTQTEGPLSTRYTVYETIRAAPFYPAADPDGTTYPTSWINYRGDYRNPLALASSSQIPYVFNGLGGQFFANLTPLKGLRLNATVAADRSDDVRRFFVPTLQNVDVKTGDVRQMDLLGPRRVTDAWTNSLHRTAFATATYETSLARVHDVSVLGGYSWESDQGRFLNGSREGIPSNALNEINAGSQNQQNSGSSYEWGIISYFGRANYEYANKYLAQANFRYDGSSRFASDQRWGFFPSFSAGWRLSQEPFLKNVQALKELKLRGSWGQLGNQNIGYYPYQSVISLGSDYTFGGEVAPGAAITRLVNNNISWEETTTTDFGLDASVGGFDLTADYFDRNTSGILRPTSIPWFLGALDPPVENLASVSNSGWEAGLKYAGNVGNLLVILGGNVTRVHNEITKLEADVIGSTNILREGESINAWYLLDAVGVYQTQADIDASPVFNDRRDLVKPGDIQYRDVNGDGTINSDDRVVAGSPVPKWTYGVTLSAQYGSVDLSSLIQGVAGASTYPTAETAFPFSGQGSVTTDWRDAWTPENGTNELPRLTTSDYAPNFTPSTFWLRSASYLRVKNLQLGYTVPSRFAQRVSLNKLRLYVNAQNVFTFTNVKNVDPERALTDNYIRDVPNVRTFSIGTNVSF